MKHFDKAYLKTPIIEVLVFTPHLH